MSTQNHHKFHSRRSTVPFSWENKPGISKLISEPMQEVKLPRPPGSPKSSTGRKSIHVPLPSCPFQPQLIKGFLKKDEDPFLAAYIECTKSLKKEKKKKRSSEFSWLKMLSCKHGNSGIREDGIVRVSERLLKRSHSHGNGLV